jgi:hypothetical protein
MSVGLDRVGAIERVEQKVRGGKYANRCLLVVVIFDLGNTKRIFPAVGQDRRQGGSRARAKVYTASYPLHFPYALGLEARPL